MSRARSSALAAAFLVAALTLPANAQVTETDLLIAGRALGFIDSLRHNSDVHVGIVYDPAIARSMQQATTFNSATANGLRIGSLVLKPVMVPIASLGSGRVEAFFLTDGLGTEAAKVARASRTRKIPCITFDIAQVRNGNCAMGVRSRPKVEVFVNRAAATATGLDLATVFRMMITEI